MKLYNNCRESIVRKKYVFFLHFNIRINWVKNLLRLVMPGQDWSTKKLYSVREYRYICCVCECLYFPPALEIIHLFVLCLLQFWHWENKKKKKILALWCNRLSCSLQCSSHMNAGLSPSCSSLPTSSWPSPGCCNQMGSEPVDGEIIFFYLALLLNNF